MLDPIRLSSVHDPFRTSSELRPPSSGSESSLGDHDEQSDDVVIFKPSTDSEMDPRWPTDRLSFFESLFPLAPETPPLYCHNPPSPDLSLVPRSPKPNEAQAIRFFLTYHERVVVPAHYFKWYDFHHFCKGWLLAMAEQSDPLRYGMVSFSALIYSMKVNLGARYTAFYYYAAALKELRLLLDNESMNLMECNIAIATALQLATIDVFSHFILELMGSDSLATPPSVFDISRAWLTSSRIARLRCGSQQPCSVDRCWNGIGISKTILAFSSHINIFFLAYGGTKTYGNDSALPNRNTTG